MGNTDAKKVLTYPETIRIAAEAKVDPKTVRRAYDGKRGIGDSHRRAVAALRSAGYLLCVLLLALGCSTDGSGLATEGTGGATALSRPSSTLPGTGGATGQATSRQLVGSGGSVQVTTVPPRGTGGSVQDAIGDTGAIVVRDAGGEVTVDDTPATCLPIEQTGCPAGQACYWGIKNAGTYTASLFCAPEGIVVLGATCTAVNDCVAGTTCWAREPNDIRTAVCVPFCNTYDNVCPDFPPIMSPKLCSAIGGSGTFETSAGICR